MLLTIVFFALLTIVFILLGGGRLLRTTGTWMTGVGKDADTVKQQMEQTASTTGKAVQKVIQTVKPGDNKGEKK